MFSKFFIERPILANVIAILTMIAGGVSLFLLPVEQFPKITPPTVQVSANYPGASPEVIANTVASPIEQQVNGVEGMLYMSSTSASDGSYNLTVTFEVGTDIDAAQILVQNRVASAVPQLPQDVQRQGVTTKKQSTAIVLFINLSSPDGRYDDTFLANYASINLRDELSRIKGVGDIRVFPAKDYSMRVWLDPEKLKGRGLTTEDVVEALREQNVQVAAGQVGKPPAPRGQNFQFTVNTLGRLSDAEQFENIIIKTAQENGTMNMGRMVRLKDVARIELGGQSYDQFFQVDGKPAAGVAMFALPGANTLDVSTAIRKRMDELAIRFPDGLVHSVPFDVTMFVAQSISEVYRTLFEAGALVLIVILIFLQDWRAVFVPATTIPVTIIGAFAAMLLFGFSVNMLTLFGLILAIGIVVDDAIVIVESAAYNIDHLKMTPKDATIKAMSELLGPILGITLVLMAVFVPAAFVGGITGQLYRQFALTIAATALISAINALTLKPAQCAVYLRKSSERKNAFYRAFNYLYAKVENVYVRILRWIVRYSLLVFVLFFVLVGATVWLYQSLPTAFLPDEDQGYVVVAAILPDAASLERTQEVVDKVNNIVMSTPGIWRCVAIGGNSIFDNAALSNAAAFYVILNSWEERYKQGQSLNSVLNNLRMRFGEIEEAMVFAFPPPAIIGVGSTGGFQMQIEDKGDVGLKELGQATGSLMMAGNGHPKLVSVTSPFRADVPQFYADVDRTKAKVLNVPLGNIFGTLQTSLGSTYVNDFNKFGRTYQVRVQAAPEFRSSANSIKQLEVRNQNGGMVPLGTVVNINESMGPQIVNRYNLYKSASLSGQAKPGVSSGEALEAMEKLATEQLPPGVGFEWTGMSYQEKRVGGQAVLIFAFAVLLVYLVLAAQYESLTSPAAVIFVVPLALLGAAAAVSLRGMDNNVYTQIGIVLIIALASKNAILIVEVARELRAHGHEIKESAIEAGRRRFRPILMTSFAFILGVVPLVFAHGAGASSRQALGTAVFGGMLAATVLAVGFVPAFFVVWQHIAEWRKKPAPVSSAQVSVHSSK